MIKQETAIFDPLIYVPPHVLDNPYARLAEMRELGPIIWSPTGDQWLVTQYEEANSILRDNRFGKRLDKWKHPNFMMRSALKIMRPANNMLLQDPPDHTRIRSLVNKAFTPKVIHALSDHITSIADKLLDEMLKKKSADLVSEFAFLLPVTVIAELLGVPSSDREQFKNWSGKITLGMDGSGCPMKIFNSIFAIQGLKKYLGAAIDIKKRNPQNDILSTLVQAQSEDNDRLSKAELLSNTILILIAGHETTVNLIGNGTFSFLTHPVQKQLILDNPDLMSGAVEEVLRYDPPVQIVRRLAKEPMEISGVKLEPNQALTILIGACNRDPRVNHNPDSFDIQRESPKHISFGAGIHYCLGSELARTEARIALRRLFERAPELALAPNSPIHYKAPFALRGLNQLIVNPNAS
jgi:cytochrome P450